MLVETRRCCSIKRTPHHKPPAKKEMKNQTTGPKGLNHDWLNRKKQKIQGRVKNKQIPEKKTFLAWPNFSFFFFHSVHFLLLLLLHSNFCNFPYAKETTHFLLLLSSPSLRPIGTLAKEAFDSRPPQKKHQAVQLFWNLTAIKHFWQNFFFEVAWNCRSLLSDQLLDFFPPSTLPPKNTSTFRWRARNGGSSGPCHFFSSARQSVSQDFAPLTCFIVRIKPGTYFNCIMFMVASSVVTTIMILNYHHRLADTHEMPNWVRTFKISHTNG